MSCFSPRNGEVILKLEGIHPSLNALGFSPRNGEVILKTWDDFEEAMKKFQSPQWGSNSKDVGDDYIITYDKVSVPAMGK